MAADRPPYISGLENRVACLEWPGGLRRGLLEGTAEHDVRIRVFVGSCTPFRLTNMTQGWSVLPDEIFEPRR